MKQYRFSISLALAVILIMADTDHAYGRSRAGSRNERKLPGLKTNTAKRTIELHELEKGGPGKDGIPSIEKPVFIEQKSAQKWLRPNEPVISLVINNESRAYPLQILIWHEIVNDTVAGVPVSVTFCPLCYSANVFDRRVNGRSYSLGVSGMLRHSDMVMYDRQTESLWQQITGEAIVGDMVGSKLKRIPAQIISFKQFRSAHKNGLVLSRKTGFRRNYGQNPYAGYDDISKSPFMYRGKKDGRLLPMEKVVTISMAGSDKAYPYSVTQKLQVINDKIADVPVVVFHADGAISALDKGRISSSRNIGSTGVFDRRVDGRTLSFRYSNGSFYDKQTASVWDITGQAVKGPLQGKKLTRIVHGDYFAFAWFAFKPETEIYQ
ncbi:MAG: DUF3179 domain-containing protein [Planctomycetes bacterium]|nr:DUF3179 domain-containing protein [Planctomycetota bacterium]